MPYTEDTVIVSAPSSTTATTTSINKNDNEDDKATVAFMSRVLTCPLTLSPMTDPVVLCCTDPRQFVYGHVYDRKMLCQSLLSFPNLDPQSNLRYTAPLFYVPCQPLAQYLKQKGEFQRHDDSHFATAYAIAWQRHQRDNLHHLERRHPREPHHHHHDHRHHDVHPRRMRLEEDNNFILGANHNNLSQATTILVVLAVVMTCLRILHGTALAPTPFSWFMSYAWALLTTKAVIIGLYIISLRQQRDTWGLILCCEVLAIALVAILHFKGLWLQGING